MGIPTLTLENRKTEQDKRQKLWLISGHEHVLSIGRAGWRSGQASGYLPFCRNHNNRQPTPFGVYHNMGKST